MSDGGEPGYVLVGNLANRRVTGFQAALTAQGLPPARELAWRELMEPGAAERLLAGARGLLRIESVGEDAEVERALLRRGEAAARAGGWPAVSAAELAAIPDEVGRILWPRQHQLGFEAVLAEIEAALAVAPELRPLQPPAAIRFLFDKAATSTAWRALGVAVPDVLPGGVVRDPDDLRARMRDAGWRSVFVKLTCGSSASCLALFTHDARGDLAVTTVEDAGAARYNTRRLRRLTDRAAIDRTLGFILGEGAHVELAIPKAKVAGRFFDCRVLAIAGEAAFVVVRTAAQPITNLHLGGTRGDLAALRARVPAASWAAAMAACVRVQETSGAFHVGVDLLFEPSLRAHRVIEGNAFGDLLPNLDRQGLDVYGWQIRRARRG